MKDCRENTALLYKARQHVENQRVYRVFISFGTPKRVCLCAQGAKEMTSYSLLRVWSLSHFQTSAGAGAWTESQMARMGS